MHPNNPIAELLRRDPRYPLDAYEFVYRALRFAQDKLQMGAPETAADEDDDSEHSTECEEDRHISGQELCEAIRQFALEEYGYMAKDVLNHWNLRETGDFGEIVFNLIGIGEMRKTDNDRREDFDDVFDFETGLSQSFKISLSDSSEERTT